MPPARRTRQVTDPHDLRALAHPLRLRLLRLVRERAPVTGAELAALVGESSASVSYHLSILARHGFIEPDPARPPTRRHKPWRATYDSDTVVSDGTGSLADTAEGALLRAMLADGRRQVDEYLARHHELPEQWRDVASFAQTSLLLLPDDVDALSEQVRAVLDRFDRAGDAADPPGARRVAVSFIAVPSDPDGARA